MKSNTYDKYVDQYRQYHASMGPGRQSGYSGRSLLKQLEGIKQHVTRTQSRTALDYGCGRGEQYTWHNFKVGERTIASVKDYLGLEEVRLFDPAVPNHAKRPEATVDIVICTDVLEHVHENDVSHVLIDIISFANKAVYLSIASYKAGTILPNGENAHVTIRKLGWWTDRINAAKAIKPDLQVALVVKHKIRLSKKLKVKWEKRKLL